MVMDAESARSINQYYILVKLADFSDEASLIPFGGVWTSLILYEHVITNGYGWESFGVFHLPLCGLHVSL